jgi:hypothetical protein
MNTIQYYEDLPDRLTTAQLQDEFAAVLAADPSREASSIAAALFELSERQWNSCELASEGLRRDVAKMVLRVWNDQDLDCAECLLGVISRLGLADVLGHLREKDASSFSASVRTALKEAIEEFGATVDDPYSGMKK